MRPVLLVHGIWDAGAKFGRMRDALVNAGFDPVRAIDLKPNDGSAPIEALGEQVEHAARQLAHDSGAEKIDLVGFSMGALVSRYYLQKLGGRERTRRFVSISGPHRGTLTAWAMAKAGVASMRPDSPLLRALANDPDPWGSCEVHALWTPYDLMIVPARSSQLPRVASEHVLPIALHRWMITHPRAVERVIAILRA